jgi:Protein of unknown function (DUF3551)
MFKTSTTLMFGIASLAVGVFFDVPASRATYFGNAQWCVVTTSDDIHWDCEYRTSQECLQVLARGIRGSCNVNPYPSAPAPVVRQKHR